MDKSPEAFRTISEVAAGMELPQHVLRFWETRFPQIKPLKRGGGRRYYRPDDVELLQAIRRLLYDEGYTIKGVQKLLREQGVSAAIHAVGPEESERSFSETSPSPPGQPPSLDESRHRQDPEIARPATAQPSDLSRADNQVSSININVLKSILAELREVEKVLSLARTI